MKRFSILIILTSLSTILITILFWQNSEIILNANSWQSMASPGHLSKSHSYLENNCSSCHTSVTGADPIKCALCHANEDVILNKQVTSAILFIGIFLTMIPAYQWLLVNGTSLGVDTPVKYFWGTGLLSGFLDNTPTYLMFFCIGKCQGIPPEIASAAVSQVGIQEVILKAISLGAVFMGGLTYIGNGPNLMVKDLAEERGVKMPSFFKFAFISLIILLPLFIIISTLLKYNLL